MLVRHGTVCFCPKHSEQRSLTYGSSDCHLAPLENKMDVCSSHNPERAFNAAYVSGRKHTQTLAGIIADFINPPRCDRRKFTLLSFRSALLCQAYRDGGVIKLQRSSNLFYSHIVKRPIKKGEKKESRKKEKGAGGLERRRPGCVLCAR